MKRLVSAFAVILVASQSHAAMARKCPDGKYRIVCPTSASGGSGRPTFMPIRAEYVGHEAEYRADMAAYRADLPAQRADLAIQRAQLERDRRAGAISQSQFNARMNAQISAENALKKAMSGGLKNNMAP